jgi:hypothetical protein
LVLSRATLEGEMLLYSLILLLGLAAMFFALPVSEAPRIKALESHCARLCWAGDLRATLRTFWAVGGRSAHRRGAEGVWRGYGADLFQLGSRLARAAALPRFLSSGLEYHGSSAGVGLPWVWAPQVACVVYSERRDRRAFEGG